MGAAIPAARLGALSLVCHARGTIIGGGDGTVTLFDNSCKDYAQTELRGGVVAMSFSADQTEVRVFFTPRKGNRFLLNDVDLQGRSIS